MEDKASSLSGVFAYAVGAGAGYSGETGPFSLSDAVNQQTAKGIVGFYVWRLNRWTGTQELCVSSATQHGCAK